MEIPIKAGVETGTAAISPGSDTIEREQAVSAEGADKKHVCFCFVFFSFVLGFCAKAAAFLFFLLFFG